jgi:glyoxylase-like metal-dependent hydrolase (beta-lactamase superfamily II)
MCTYSMTKVRLILHPSTAAQRSFSGVATATDASGTPGRFYPATGIASIGLPNTLEQLDAGRTRAHSGRLSRCLDLIALLDPTRGSARANDGGDVARLDVLFEGYATHAGVASTVSLLRDADVVAVVDPGMVPSRAAILDPLADLGVTPDEVTDVILSHHHPDHTVNIALFPEVTIHDHWATYHRDQWTSREAEGVQLSPGIKLWETPGHTPQDITTLVDTDEGVAALTHLWVYETSPGRPLDVDPAQVVEHRARVLKVATLIVPGHGPAFRVS